MMLKNLRALPGHTCRSKHTLKKRRVFVAEGKVNTFRRLTLPGKSQSVCAYKMHVYYMYIIHCICYITYLVYYTKLNIVLA